MKKFFAKLFGLIIILLLFASLYGWSNFWLPNNSFGILFNKNFETPKLIQNNEFNWYWQRLIPRSTTLIAVPNIQSSTSHTNFFLLPHNKYFENTSSNNTPSNYTVDYNVVVEYTISQDKIISYIAQQYKNTIPINGEAILKQLENQIESSFFSLRQPSIPENISSKVMLEQSFNTFVKSTLTPLLSKLPITINTIDTHLLYVPNIEQYNQSKSKADALDSLDTQLGQYLLFLKELGTIVSDNPLLIDLIKVLPPKDVLGISPPSKK